MLASCFLAVLLASGLYPGPAEATPSGPASERAMVFHDDHEGDPPHDERHRESPAKKSRLGTLLVHTSCTSAGTAPQGFHLQSAARAPDARRQARGLAFDLSAPARRTDPALRLHPGQAPPRAA